MAWAMPGQELGFIGLTVSWLGLFQVLETQKAEIPQLRNISSLMIIWGVYSLIRRKRGLPGLGCQTRGMQTDFHIWRVEGPGLRVQDHGGPTGIVLKSLPCTIGPKQKNSGLQGGVAKVGSLIEGTKG